MMIEVLPDLSIPHWATFSINEVNLIIVSDAIIHLELLDVFVDQGKRNRGYGTVLMICALEMAKLWKLDTMKGVYHPRGNISNTKQWYMDLGATFDGKLVTGEVETMYHRCQQIKNIHKIEYQLLKPEIS